MFEKVGEYITKKIRERSAIQGHTLTGKFEAGLGYRIDNNDTIVGIDETGVGKWIDKKLPADKVPFTFGSGAGKSKFIEGLTRYAEQRFGLSDKKALSAAFAMAVTMKREGRPTTGSYFYTKNGSRTGVVSDTLTSETETIKQMIVNEAGKAIKIEFENLIRKYKWQ